MEGYIKCELIGGGSSRQLKQFQTGLMLLYTTYISILAMFVAIVVCTHVTMSTQNNQNIHIMLPLFTVPI